MLKISGPDQIIRLLLEMNAEGRNVEDPGENENYEELSKGIEKIVLQKDEAIIGTSEALKSEVQFIRGSNESPEIYLQRISSEIITQKEALKSGRTDGFSEENLDNNIADHAIRSGLNKEASRFNKDIEDNTLIEAQEIKWLLKITTLFFISLLIYLIFIV